MLAVAQPHAIGDAVAGRAGVIPDALVANCTCNGKNAMGLAPYDLPTDPTLRPGDIVATKNGLMTYTGNPAQAYTPVTVPGVATQVNSATTQKSALNSGRPATPAAPVGDSGAVAQAQPLTTGAVAARWPR